MLFEDFLCEKNAAIDEAAYRLITELVTTSVEHCDNSEIKWDQRWISEVVMAAERVIEISMETNVCHPFYSGDDEKPCYLDDCCTKGCPFKKEMDNSGERFIRNVKNDHDKFKSSLMGKSPAEIYNDAFKINFFEEYFNFFVNGAYKEFLHEKVIEWLSSFNRPLETLYSLFLECDLAPSYDWNDMADWLSVMAEEGAAEE